MPSGIDMASRFDSDGLAACTAAGGSAGGCGQAVRAFSARFDSVMGLLPWLNFVPGLVGVMLAAPVLLDLESGTLPARLDAEHHATAVARGRSSG